MSESEPTHQSSISKGQSFEEIAEFWETHSLGDYWDQTREVELEVRVRRRRRVTVDPDVYQRIETEARLRGLSPETLVNLWLVERLQRTGVPGEGSEEKPTP